MERLFKIILLLLVFSISEQAFSEDFVLVASSASQYEKFSSLELRKVFLGYGLRKNEREIQAVINMAQEDSYDRFLQLVVSMSASRYEKQLLFQTFRQGRSRPEIVDDIANLKKLLAEKPESISFMRGEDVEQSPELRIVQVLWTSSE